MKAAALVALLGAASAQRSAPEQFHVSFTADPRELSVTWASVGDREAAAPNARCEFGLDPRELQWTAAAASSTYVDGACDWCQGWDGLVFSAVLPELPPSAPVFYRCGDDGVGLSERVRNTTSRPAADAGAPRRPFSMAFYGDAGFDENAQAVTRDVMAADVDVVHVAGDIAYANGNQSLWDTWGRVQEPLMEHVPTLFSPGNHDGRYVWGNYDEDPLGEDTGGGESGVAYATRLPGPGPKVAFNSSITGPMESTSFWWSVDHEAMTLVALSGAHNFSAGSPQYAFAEEALAAADREWLVLSVHYPLLCSMSDCYCQYANESACWEGQPADHPDDGVLAVTALMMLDELEPLILKHGVDLVLAGHEHAYERTRPARELQVADWADHEYVDPAAPVHVMVGTGGGSADEGWLPAGTPGYEWSVSRSDTRVTDSRPYGWLKLDVAPGRLEGAYFNHASSSAPFDWFSISHGESHLEAGQ